MRASLTLFGIFIIGVCIGRFDVLPAWFFETNYTIYVLFLLVFLVGLSIGSDKKTLKQMREQDKRVLLLPLTTIIGTLFGVYCVSFFMSDWTWSECLAVGSGFGYYSLSSVLITEVKGVELGTVALMANVMRELACLLFAPLLAKYFGKYAPISVGGATSMDSTLPVIVKFSGKDFAVPSIIHGFCVDLSVPFLVSFFLAF